MSVTALAAAAPPDQTPLITNNIQGASSGGDAASKWTTTVHNYIRSVEIVLLQEVGPSPPPSSRQVERIPYVQGPIPQNSNWGQILHHQWSPGSSTRDGSFEVYFLQTDPNGGTWTGGRVNLAIVTHRPADEVRVVLNPVDEGRPALGVRFGSDWYFTLHALSSSGRDAAPLVDAIDDAVEEWGNGSHHWTVAGDFNIDPALLGRDPQLPPSHVYSSGSVTQRSGGELDYAVSSHALGGDYPVHRLNGATPDHFAVNIGGIRANAEVKLGAHGDSNTHGFKSSTGNGYRAFLYGMLLSGLSIDGVAKRSLDFVGSQSSGDMADPQHEGYPGFTISQIANELATTVPLHRPNVVTLHAGTNDMKTDRDAAGAPERLGALIDQLLRDSPGVAVLVATLVPSSDPATQARIDAFNRALPGIVASRRQRGAHVALVDMGAVTVADLADPLHPSDAGYRKMADAFADAVVQAFVDGWITSPIEGTACTTPGGWLPQGQIASGTGTNATSPTSPRIALADLDGDGRDDYLTIAYESGVTSAWLNKGGDRPGVAGWVARGQVATGTGLAGTIYFADLNGDRRDDYLVVDPRSGAASAWINGGGNTPDGRSWIWHPKGQVASGTGVAGAIRFADVNGDERDDYLVLDTQTGAVHAWLNGGGDIREGSGWIWYPAGQIASGVSPAASVVLADADGDGRDDYLVVDARTGAVDAWLNRGGDRPGVSGWIPRGRIASGVGVSGAMVRFADVNADGRDDYLAFDNSGAIRAWLNNCGDPP